MLLLCCGLWRGQYLRWCSVMRLPPHLLQHLCNISGSSSISCSCSCSSCLNEINLSPVSSVTDWQMWRGAEWLHTSDCPNSFVFFQLELILSSCRETQQQGRGLRLSVCVNIWNKTRAWLGCCTYRNIIIKLYHRPIKYLTWSWCKSGLVLITERLRQCGTKLRREGQQPELIF